jgi:seryl-tRNA(Sec) selenium transferase
MAKNGKAKRKAKRKAWVLGVGLDNRDGHTRVTTGANFRLFGGSEETHGTMTEKAIKLNEHLKRRGKTLDTISREEFHEIAHEVGMRLLPDRERPKDH